MQVTLIGSGNMATVLGRMLVRGGHIIRQVYSRQSAHAALLANELGGMAVADIAAVDAEADLYLVCVTDGAIPLVAAELQVGSRLLVHTAGAVGKDTLSSASTRYGVLWPMKMTRKTMQELGPVSVMIDGNTPGVIADISRVAALFSPTIVTADDATRAKMHMVASFTANFTNHLYHLAADYCAAEGIDFSLFYTNIEEAAKAVQLMHPSEAQAGPAFRGDFKTLEKHESLLEHYPGPRAVYELLTRSLLEKFGHSRV